MNKPEWKYAPDWANYLAQETNEDWYWYEKSPVWNNTSMEWNTTDKGIIKKADTVDAARDSYEVRPKEETLMLQLFAKTLAATLLPKIAEEAYEFVKSKFENDDKVKDEPVEIPKKKPVRRPGRKIVDTSPITKEMVQFAKDSYKEWKLDGMINGESILTQADLTKYVNKKFGIDKSRTVIMKMVDGAYDEKV